MYYNPFSIPLFITAIASLVIGALVLSKKQSLLNKIFFAFCLSLFVWLFSYALMYNSRSISLGLNFARCGFTAIVFIPILGYHFIVTLIDRSNKVILRVIYFSSIPSIILGWTNLIYKGVKEYFWGFYPSAGKLYFVFLIQFILLFTFGLSLLLKEMFSNNYKNNLLKLIQIKYVFWAFLLGTTGLIDYILKYDLPIVIYPFGYLSALIFIVVIAYAIIRHRLLDVRVAFTKAGIFFLVYTLVLGLPFYLYYRSYNFLALILMLCLSTLGPYIYMYIQRKTEEKLFKEQKQYQNTLRKASLGMGRIKDLKRLLNLIVHIVARTVRIEHCEVYLFHEASNKFILKASKNDVRCFLNNSTLSVDSPLVQYLSKLKEPVVAEEFTQKYRDSNDSFLSGVIMDMNALDAALILPSFIEQRLLALIILGKKKSKKIYTQDDMVVFSILANQSALAIENAQFYEDMRKTHEQLFKAEKMATIGTMADGLSHQINNRLHAMGFIAGDAIDTIRIRRRENLPDADKEFLDEMESALLKIEDNVKRGGEIVGGLLKYTRKGEQGLGPVELNSLIESSIEMVQFKIKMRDLDIINKIDKNMPAIHGNFTQLQEVFFNIIDNAYDSITERKEDVREPGYRGRVEISAETKGKMIVIKVMDNGLGVKKEDLRKLFTPFFTTKLSSRKGTGLGLYVIRQIVEENHKGKVILESEYMAGVTSYVHLPVFLDLRPHLM